jgi:hypothetical protein
VLKKPKKTRVGITAGSGFLVFGHQSGEQSGYSIDEILVIG